MLESLLGKCFFGHSYEVCYKDIWGRSVIFYCKYCPMHKVDWISKYEKLDQDCEHCEAAGRNERFMNPNWEFDKLKKDFEEAKEKNGLFYELKSAVHQLNKSSRNSLIKILEEGIEMYHSNPGGAGSSAAVAMSHLKTTSRMAKLIEEFKSV